MTHEFITQQHPKTLIVSVISPYHFIKHHESYVEEFKNLVKSNNIIYDHELFIKLREVDSGNFLTKGKLEELIALCIKEKIKEVIFSVPLSVQQERNLNKLLNCRVYDRNQLILEIFEKGATSSEGKTQVAIAMLQHLKARLAGRGVHLSQQAGKIGTRGPGETQKENEKQHIEHLMVKMRRDLEKLAQIRETQRKQRLTAQIPSLCLIGYTNSGKSTILNALTKSDVLAEDKLFATLDTTTRELYVDHKKVGVISDTVGFIQQLPHHLIEAFKSTLTEVKYAHALLHVVDSADPNWPEHIEVVNKVLEEMEIKDPHILYIFNKIDKVKDLPSFALAVEKFQPHVLVSALEPKGLDPLKAFLGAWKPIK